MNRWLVGQASSPSSGLPAPVSSAGRMPGKTGWKPVLLHRAGSGRQGAENVRRILSLSIRFAFASLAGLAALLPASASACASCFGQSDSPMANGMNAGIFTLLFVITSVLLAVAIFFAFILRRAARLSEGAVAPEAETRSRKTHGRVVHPSADLMSTPLQRGVTASDVVGTVSTVSTGCEKPLKRFLLSSRPGTPLKRGANERELPQPEKCEISGQPPLATAAHPVFQPTH